MIQPDLRDWKNSQEALEYKADLHLLLGQMYWERLMPGWGKETIWSK